MVRFGWCKAFKWQKREIQTFSLLNSLLQGGSCSDSQRSIHFPSQPSGLTQPCPHALSIASQLYQCWPLPGYLSLSTSSLLTVPQKSCPPFLRCCLHRVYVLAFLGKFSPTWSLLVLVTLNPLLRQKLLSKTLPRGLSTSISLNSHILDFCPDPGFTFFRTLFIHHTAMFPVPHLILSSRSLCLHNGYCFSPSLVVYLHVVVLPWLEKKCIDWVIKGSVKTVIDSSLWNYKPLKSVGLGL